MNDDHQQEMEHGTNTMGRPFRADGGSWCRMDNYQSKETGEVTMERRFCAGANDQTDVAVTPYAGKPGNINYNGDACPSCYLHQSHTVACHQAAVGAYWAALKR